MNLTFHQWTIKGASELAAFKPIRGDEVQIWSVDLASDAICLDGWEQVLSLDELERAEKFKVMEPRRQFIVARGLLRILLGKHLGVAPSELKFGVRERGKPFLMLPSASGNVRFSVSHTQGLVVIALAQGRELGVDVEWLQRKLDWRAIAERFFSSREIQVLEALPSSQQTEAFFTGWTRKEAYLKATGEGLTNALHEIEVTLAPDEKPRLLAVPRDGDDARKWDVHSLNLPKGYVGSLVVES